MPTPAPAASGAFWVYRDGAFAWQGEWSFGASVDFRDVNCQSLSGGSTCIRVNVTGQWGGFQPYSVDFDTRPYSRVTIALKPTIAGQGWDLYFLLAGDVDIGRHLDITKYGPAPVAGRWGVYTIPLADLGAAQTRILKFALQDRTGRAGHAYFVDAIGFLP